jgi:hypothetical protein
VDLVVGKIGSDSLVGGSQPLQRLLDLVDSDLFQMHLAEDEIERDGSSQRSTIANPDQHSLDRSSWTCFVGGMGLAMV